MKLKTRSRVKATLITAFLLTFTLTSAAQTPFDIPLPGAATSKQGPPQEPYTGVMESPSRSAIPSQVEPVSMFADDVSQVYLPDVPLPAASENNSGVPRVHVQGEYVDFQENSNASSVQPPGSANANDSQSSPTAVTSPQLQQAANSPVSNAPGNSVSQWSGVGNSGWSPPDTVGAVGPTHVVEAVNSGFAIWNKTGTLTQAYRTFDSFMNKPAGWAGSMFDPRIVYDSISNHFVMMIMGKDDANVKSYIWIAISQTTDPNGTWNLHRYDTTDTSGASTAWLDYAGLGVDANGVYFTGNYFYFSGGYRGSTLWNLNPAMLTGGANNGWVWKDLKWPSGSSAFTIQPALPHSVNSNNESYFVNTHSGSGSEVLLWKLAGTYSTTASRGLSRVAIPISAYDAIGNNVDQPGSTTDIDGGDARVMNAVYANRRVFFTLTDDVSSNGASSGALTVKLNSDTNTKEWDSIYWGGAGKYVTYPAVTLQGSGVDNNLGIFASWTDGTSIYASSVFAFYDNQPNAGVSYSQFLENGLAPYVYVFGGRNRWGDYSGAAYDWSTGDFWGFAERALTGNTWGTTVSRRDAGGPPVPQITVTSPNGGEIWNSGTSRTVTWTSNDLPSSDEIYIYLTSPTTLKLAGPISRTLTSYSVTVPEIPSTNAEIFVGSYNPTNTDQAGIGYTVSDRSDSVFTIVDQTPPSPDPMTFSVLPQATSSSQITMTATTASDVSTPVSYYLLYTGSPTTGAGGSSLGWVSGTVHNDAGLQPNHEYCYQAYARDGKFNQAAPSSNSCNYTFANPPVAAAFTNIQETGIQANWTANSNRAGTQYLVENNTGSTNSGWTSNTSWTSNGLTCNSPYNFQVRARNADGIETGIVALGSATTAACPVDTDGDGIFDSADNCILVINPTQCDGDNDQYGNHCDGDFTNDGITNGLDVGPFKAGFGTTNPVTDLNCDGITNGLDVGPFKAMFGTAPGPSGFH